MNVAFFKLKIDYTAEFLRIWQPEAFIRTPQYQGAEKHDQKKGPQNKTKGNETKTKGNETKTKGNETKTKFPSRSPSHYCQSQICLGGMEKGIVGSLGGTSLKTTEARPR